MKYNVIVSLLFTTSITGCVHGMKAESHSTIAGNWYVVNWYDVAKNKEVPSNILKMDISKQIKVYNSLQKKPLCNFWGNPALTIDSQGKGLMAWESVSMPVKSSKNAKMRITRGTIPIVVDVKNNTLTTTADAGFLSKAELSKNQSIHMVFHPDQFIEIGMYGAHLIARSDIAPTEDCR